MRRFSVEYVDRLLRSGDVFDLATLLSIIWGGPQFLKDKPDYGLAAPAFVFVEAQIWLAQAVRSGVWTYYDATALSRQTAMLEALRMCAPVTFAERYEFGMSNWEDSTRAKELGNWIGENEDEVVDWLRQLAVANREIVMELTG